MVIGGGGADVVLGVAAAGAVIRKNGFVESAATGGAGAGAGKEGLSFSMRKKGFVPVLLAEGDVVGSLGGGGLEIDNFS